MTSAVGSFAAMRVAWRVLFALAVVWSAVLLQRGVRIAPDELEFFRATRWVGMGRVPFRDFWEHHTPLQWILFSPWARWVADGAGTSAIVLMRWAHVPLWIASILLLRRATTVVWASFLPALAFLLASPTFVRRAIEYRVDVLGNLLFLAALFLIVTGSGRRRYALSGALLSASVLANMRMAPLAVVLAALTLFWQREPRRWALNPRAFWIAPGAIGVAAAFIAFLSATEAWSPFAAAMFEYNAISGRLLDVSTFGDAILAPLWTLDIAGMAYWLAGGVGCLFVLRRIREAGALQLVALLALASIGSLALMKVQYDYHLQSSWLLLLPLVAVAYESLLAPRWEGVVAGIAAAGLTVSFLQVIPSFGAEMAYQDRVMRAADAFTRDGETVFDGAGYVLRREPAYRYWFLTTGVRMMAAQRLIEPFDLAQVLRAPPAAIVYDYRLDVYLREFPELARYLAQHYLPVYRNLWVPGLTAVTAAGTTRIVWTAPRAGVYRIVVSESLATHPWLRKPFEYAALQGIPATQYAIPLARLPLLPAAAHRWIVDGVAPPSGATTLSLRKGARVEALIDHPRPAGVLLVPEGVDILCMAPPEEFAF